MAWHLSELLQQHHNRHSVPFGDLHNGRMVHPTCIRRAVAIPGCGTSPSPAISLEVSIMTTLLWAASASMLEMSLIAVVFPTPGRPSSSIDLPDSTTSAAIFALPVMALPTRQVRPTICPSRLRMQLILCRHLLIPARLSPPNSPTCLQTHSSSAMQACVSFQANWQPPQPAQVGLA